MVLGTRLEDAKSYPTSERLVVRYITQQVTLSQSTVPLRMSRWLPVPMYSLEKLRVVATVTVERKDLGATIVVLTNSCNNLGV